MPPEVPSASPGKTEPNTTAQALSAAAAATAPKADPRLKQIRTYQGDVEEALRSQHESVFSIREQELARQKLLEKSALASSQAPVQQQPLPVRPEPGPTIGPHVIPAYTPDIAPNVPHVEVQLTPIIEPRPEVPVPLPQAQVLEVRPPQPLPRRAEIVKAPNDWKTAGLFILSLALLAGAGTAGYFAYEKYQTKVAVPVTVTPPNRLVAPESSTMIDTTHSMRSTIVSTLSTDRLTPLAAGTIKQIDLRKGEGLTASTTPTADFFNLLATHAPSALVRAFNPAFMLGLIGNGNGTPASTFLIMNIDSFDNVFAGMLDWEQDIPEDLVPLFYDASSSDAILSATSSPAFQDLIVKNKDTRALRDATGKTVLIYSFFNQKTLIITDSEDNLRSIIALLTAEELSH